VRQNNFLDALELALSFYDGTAVAVIGLSYFQRLFFSTFVFDFPISHPVNVPYIKDVLP